MQKLKYGLVMAVCVAGALGVAMPVTAAAAPTALPGNSGYITFWDDNGYRDRFIDFTNGEGSDDLDDLGFEDKASSFVNKTSTYWVIYENKNRLGRKLCVRPNSHLTNMNDVSFGDKMSSLRQARSAISSCDGATAIGQPN
ncbi:peptidase inhibitor family I36 protein [Lentzea sp. NPDC051208]|uniref:peptidase inhibitor family I36 protein n=1 Tax=Lentzea sp. NPDC051208 TaxID=3154642 RepID=UPI003431F9A5